MPQKMYSLHIGVNYVDEKHYPGGLQELPCCSNDAMAMQRLMQKLNYDDTDLLLNEKATARNLKTHVTKLSKKLKKGDLLVISYSGHGGVVKDLDGDEESGTDSTWCLYDRQLVDDELPLLWAKFKTGVNIFLVLDSCHSGTASKAALPVSKGGAPAEEAIDFMDNFRPRVKSMNFAQASKTYRKNKDTYKKVSAQVKREKKGKETVKIKATVQLIAACQDEEEALTGFTFSQFTDFILSNLGQTKRYNTFEKLFNRVRKISEKKLQITPNWYQIGTPTKYFNTNRPFMKKGASYPKDFKNIYDILEDEVFAMDEIGFGMDGLIIDAPAKAQKSISRSAKSTINSATTLSKSATAKGETTPIFIETKKTKGVAHPWDQAYSFYGKHAVGQKDVFIEPSFYGTQKVSSKSASSGGGGSGSYMNNWPKPHSGPEEFIWHLTDDYSQLAKARNSLMRDLSVKELAIKIAHFDTGFAPKHPSTPKNTTQGISFVKGEEGKPAIDKKKNSVAENQYHGTATLALLAGNEVTSKLTYADYNGFVGAIPFAEVVPIRISDTVALIGILNNTRQFTQAIDFAIKNKCEVITMSMGGQPHRSWAKAINRAYEAGITIVTAAGNSFVKGAMRVLPKKLIYPARFDRVIAATGISANKQPYVFKANNNLMGKTAGGEFMQGNFGPRSAMDTAIAAYTPNLPWAEMKNGKPVFLRAGGGTSSATPQVAAAAALWIVKHRKELKAKGYAGTWKQVEAVRHALFTSADRSYPLWKKYFGQGSLKAFNALAIAPPPLSKLKKSDKARVTPFAFLEFIQLMILRKGKAKAAARDKQLEEMAALEMLQILHIDPNLHHFVEDLDLFNPKELTRAQFNFLFNKIKASDYASNFLRTLHNGTNVKKKR